MDKDQEEDHRIDETHPINPPLIAGVAFGVGVASSVVYTVRDDLGFGGFMMLFAGTLIISSRVFLLMRFIRNA